MKHRTYGWILSMTAALLCVLLSIQGAKESVTLAVISWPFDGIVKVMTALSSYGSFGKGAAGALFAAVCSIPVLIALCGKNFGDNIVRNTALCMTTLVMVICLRGIADPTVYFPNQAGVDIAIWKGMLSVTIWSFLILCAVLDILKKFRKGDTETLLRYLVKGMYALGWLFLIVGILNAAPEIRTVKEQPMNGDTIFAWIGFVTILIPYLLSIVVCVRVADLLKTALCNEHKQTEVCAGKVVKASCVTLGVTVTLTAIYNFLQVLFGKYLTNIQTSVELPVSMIVFVLLVLLSTGLLSENRRLHEDNDLFI